jgi:GntR family transcriptional regulator
MPEMPKYLQLAQDLRASIESGQYPVGQMIPTESDLCKHYGVSRITVRAAIQELSAQGLVSKRPGVGTHVVRKDTPQRFVHTSDSVESVLQFTEETRFELIKHGIVDEIDPSLARVGSPAGQKRLWVQGVRWGAERSVCVTDLYMSVLHHAIVDALPNHRGSIILLVQRLFGVELKEIEQVIEAVALNKRQAQALQALAGSPALLTRRWHRDPAGNTLIASISVYPSDRYSYSVLLRQNPANPTV